MHWQEQKRDLEKISPMNLKYADEQLIQFLDNCVASVDGWNTVRETWKTANDAAGGHGMLTFDAYVDKLVLMGEKLDKKRNPLSRTSRFSGRQAHVHELIFENNDGEEVVIPIEEPQEEPDLQVNVHTIDMPLDEIQVNWNGQSRAKTPSPSAPQRIRTRMDFTTWKTLLQPSKTAWESITNEDKVKIIKYFKEKGAKEALKTSKTPPGSTNMRRVNTHQLMLPPQQTEDVARSQDEVLVEAFFTKPKAPSSQPTLQANVHQVQESPNPMLEMASKKVPSEGHIAAILSSHVKKVCKEESSEVPHIQANTVT